MKKKIAQELANKLNLDIIISDNRFGFRSTKTTNIFLSHQISHSRAVAIKTNTL